MTDDKAECFNLTLLRKWACLRVCTDSRQRTAHLPRRSTTPASTSRVAAPAQNRAGRESIRK